MEKESSLNSPDAYNPQDEEAESEIVDTETEEHSDIASSNEDIEFEDDRVSNGSPNRARYRIPNNG